MPAPLSQSALKRGTQPTTEVAPNASVVGISVGGGWLLMDSAPTDGSPVLLWTDTNAGDEELIDYIETFCEGEHFAQVQIGEFCNVDRKWEAPRIGVPLFWQPLPLSPSCANCGSYLCECPDHLWRGPSDLGANCFHKGGF